jgi:aldose 1-epimerase
MATPSPAVEQWGELNGEPIRLFTLANNNGIVARISNLGATLQSLVVPDSRGQPADVVLGYDRPEDYLSGGAYFGATVGRYGNRIRAGRFTLDDVEYQLACNEGKNHLHGGVNGYDKRLWAAAGPDGNTVRFGLVSPDGDEGYPGTLVAEVSYSLDDDNTFTIAMLATVSRPSPVNLVHHSYFNLAGEGTVLGHEIEIAADFYTPVDADLIPTGEIVAVVGTPFDFNSAKPVGQGIDRIDNYGAGKSAGERFGFDHNWVLRGQSGHLRPAVTLREPTSGRGFELSTTEPGTQFYAGGYLDGVAGKQGAVYPKYGGLALETQKFPASPNIPHLPTSRVDPGVLYRHVCQYRFFS